MRRTILLGSLMGLTLGACGGLPPSEQTSVEEAATRRPITVSQLTGIKNGFNESFMNSFMLFPCYGRAAQDCLTVPIGQFCPNTSSALPREQRGVVTHEFFQLGGTIGRNYQVTLSVSGITEAKYYQGGVRSAGEGALPNPDAPNGVDTFYTGGTPVDFEFYNIYKLVVRNPPAAGAPIGSGTEVQHYYLNSFPRTSVPYENHRTFPIHYLHNITVPGGGTIEYLLNDSNCRAIDNCGPGPRSSLCTDPSLPRSIPTEPGLLIPQTYMGQQVSTLNVVNGANQPFHSQILHLKVTAVSAL